MNRQKRTRKWTGMLLLVLAWPFAMPTSAQDKDPPRKENVPGPSSDAKLVVTDLRMIEMTETAAENLFRGGLARVSTVDETALADLRIMLTNGMARTVARMRVSTLSGQNAEIKDIIEYRYANDYKELGWPLSDASPLGTNDTAAIRMPCAMAVRPASFETRQAGFILNVTPVVEPDGKTIQLTLLPQTIGGPSFRDIQATGPGGEVRVQQPEFGVLTTASSVTVRHGDTILLSAVTPPGHQGDTIVLFLLTASIADGGQ